MWRSGSVISGLLAILVHYSHGHGMLYWPPQRSCLWRYGYFSPINYNDNALWCGGIDKFREAGERCGTCGDPFFGPHEHEAGGKYALGIIGAKYPPGLKYLDVVVRLDASHRGYFEFKICPHDNPGRPVEQQCLDKHPLPLKDTGMMRFYPGISGDIPLTLVLPDGIKCSQCVLQWRYVAGNSWGVNSTGHGCMGCGVQETFQNCADISIGGENSNHNQYFGTASYYNPPEEGNYHFEEDTVPVDAKLIKSSPPTDLKPLVQETTVPISTKSGKALQKKYGQEISNGIQETDIKKPTKNFKFFNLERSKKLHLPSDTRKINSFLQESALTNNLQTQEQKIYFKITKNADVLRQLPESRSSASARSTRPFLFTLYQSSKYKGGNPRILARINIGNKQYMSKKRTIYNSEKTKALGKYFMRELLSHLKRFLQTSHVFSQSNKDPEIRLSMLLEKTLPNLMDNLDICLLDSELCSQ